MPGADDTAAVRLVYKPVQVAVGCGCPSPPAQVCPVYMGSQDVSPLPNILSASSWEALLCWPLPTCGLSPFSRESANLPLNVPGTVSTFMLCCSLLRAAHLHLASPLPGPPRPKTAPGPGKPIWWAGDPSLTSHKIRTIFCHGTHLTGLSLFFLSFSP